MLAAAFLAANAAPEPSTWAMPRAARPRSPPEHADEGSNWKARTFARVKLAGNDTLAFNAPFLDGSRRSRASRSTSNPSFSACKISAQIKGSIQGTLIQRVY